MAALPYMQLYVADYLADTMHLSTEEHGAYLLLIFNYWQTGKPIPKSRLARITRLSNERWTVVERALNEFFNERDDEWVHERVERDLDAVHASQTQRSAAGKASAEARKNRAKSRHTRLGNDRSTTVEVSLNENPTNRDTDTDTDTEESRSRALPAAAAPAPLTVIPVEPAPKAKRKSTIPETFLLTTEMAKWARERAPAANLPLETEKFVNHYRGKGDLRADWVASWRTWMLNAQTYAQRPSRGGGAAEPNFDDLSWADDLGVL